MTGALASLTMAGRQRGIGIAVLVVAVVLRSAMTVPAFFHYPDEVWQYLEPAYGLAHGRSIVTWEYREGIRGWLIPVMLGVPFHLAAAMGVPSHVVIAFIKFALGLASTVIVYSGARIAQRLSAVHGLVTAIVLATSLDLILFGTRPLSEAMAADLLMPAAAALTLPPERQRRSWLIAAGLCLGLAACFRFQLIPMVGALAMLTLRTNWKGWGMLLLGVAGALLIAAAADISQGAVPFRWMVRNVMLNVVERRSEAYGTAPPAWYLFELARLWGVFALPLSVLVGIGARRVPILVIVALVNIAFHALVAHKELRFIFPSTPFLLTAAGIGAADLLTWVNRRRGGLVTVALAAVFLGSSICAAITPVGRSRFQGRRLLTLWSRMHEERKLCGVAVYGKTLGLPLAHVFIDRPVKLYSFQNGDRGGFGRNRPAYNVVIAAQSAAQVMRAGGYSLRWCAVSLRSDSAGLRDLCYYQRPGGCANGDPRYLANAVLARERE